MDARRGSRLSSSEQGFDRPAQLQSWAPHPPTHSLAGSLQCPVSSDSLVCSTAQCTRVLIWAGLGWSSMQLRVPSTDVRCSRLKTQCCGRSAVYIRPLDVMAHRKALRLTLACPFGGQEMYCAVFH